jgi:hypothetical protein
MPTPPAVAVWPVLQAQRQQSLNARMQSVADAPAAHAALAAGSLSLENATPVMAQQLAQLASLMTPEMMALMIDNCNMLRAEKLREEAEAAAAAERKRLKDETMASFVEAWGKVQQHGMQDVSAVRKLLGLPAAPAFIKPERLPNQWDGKDPTRQPRTWLKDMLVAYRHNEQEALERLALNMSGVPREKWEANLKHLEASGVVLTWEKACEEFVRMESGELDAQARIARHNLLSHAISMKGTNYQAYVQEFKGAEVHCSDMDQRTKAYLFLAGLHPDLAKACARDPAGEEWQQLEKLIKFGYGPASILAAQAGQKRPATLAAAEADQADGAAAPAFARKQERGGGRGRGRGRSRGNSRGRSEGGTPPALDRKGERSRERSPVPGLSHGNAGLAKDQCRKCLGMGHHEKQCPSKYHAKRPSQGGDKGKADA